MEQQPAINTPASPESDGITKQIYGAVILAIVLLIGYLVLKRSQGDATVAAPAASAGNSLSDLNNLVDKVFGSKNNPEEAIVESGTATNSGSNQAVFFQDCDYQGSFQVALGPGKYDSEALRKLGIMDSEISSVRVPPWFKVTMYDLNFNGRKLVLTKDAPCLKSYGFNDMVTSIIIEKVSS